MMSCFMFQCPSCAIVSTGNDQVYGNLAAYEGVLGLWGGRATGLEKQRIVREHNETKEGLMKVKNVDRGT